MSGFLWVGSEESYGAVLQAREKVEHAHLNMKAGWLQDTLDALPPIWEMRGTTAVVNISGPLVDGSAGFDRIFGVIGYDDIAQAVIDAASNPDTQKLLFNMNTPGGDVNGVMDLARLLGQVTAMKPSAVYTGAQMASGGYWLATGIKGPIVASQTAMVGSIGVVMILTDVQGMMEQNGVKKTVVRSGQYKAEINSFETPSPEALDRLRSQMSDVHDLFRAAVGAARPNLDATQLKDVTQGQTFMGQKAKAAGLVDKVGNFDVALKLLDSQKPASNTSPTSKGKAMKITDLSPEQLAAIAAGASPASFGVTEDLNPAPVVPAPAAPVVAAAPAPAAAVPAAAPDPVAFYQAQLTTANAQLVASQVELQQLKVSTQTQTANFDALMKIAREATGKMHVALGGTAAAADTLDAASLVTEYARVSATFLEKFKPGQQSGQQEVKPPEPIKAQIDPRFFSAVRSAPSAA